MLRWHVFFLQRQLFFKLPCHLLVFLQPLFPAYRGSSSILVTLSMWCEGFLCTVVHIIEEIQFPGTLNSYFTFFSEDYVKKIHLTFPFFSKTSHPTHLLLSSSQTPRRRLEKNFGKLWQLFGKLPCKKVNTGIKIVRPPRRNRSLHGVRKVYVLVWMMILIQCHIFISDLILGQNERKKASEQGKLK